MINADVHKIKAGPMLGEITRRNAGGAKINIFELHEGLLPEQYAGRASVYAFIAQERAVGYDEAAVVVEETGEGVVAVAIEPRAKDVIEHPDYLQGIFSVAMRESGIDTRTAYIDAEILPNGSLERMGVEYSQLTSV